MTLKTCPSFDAASTSAWTEAREETSTVAVLTLKPASKRTLCRRVGVLLPDVGQQNVLACTDPPHDCLADRTCSDDYDHILSFRSLLYFVFWMLRHKGAFIALMSKT